MVLLMGWLVDMKLACNLLLVASESPEACLFSYAPSAIYFYIALIADFHYILRFIFSLFPRILNYHIADMSLNLYSSLKVLPQII